MLIYAKKDKGKYTWNRKPKVTYEEPVRKKPKEKEVTKDMLSYAKEVNGKNTWNRKSKVTYEEPVRKIAEKPPAKRKTMKMFHEPIYGGHPVTY